MGSDETKNVISAIGCGIGESFDITKLRYNKIISLCDSDSDGKHIECLLFTFFFVHMPELIEAGHVYAGNAPKYILKKGASKIGYLNTDKDRDDWIVERAQKLFEFDGIPTIEDLTKEDIEEITKGYTFGYIKGLGELNPEELGETALNPENRILQQLKIEDWDEVHAAFKVMMDSTSSVVPERKKFIEENALDAVLDI